MGPRFDLSDIHVRKTILSYLLMLPTCKFSRRGEKNIQTRDGFFETETLLEGSIRQLFSKSQWHHSYKNQHVINPVFFFFPLICCLRESSNFSSSFCVFLSSVCVWAAVRCATCPPPDAASSCRCTRRSLAHPSVLLFARWSFSLPPRLAAAAMSAAAPAAPAAGSTYAFNADIAQLMSLIINTFYSVRTEINSHTRQHQQQRTTNRSR